VVKPGEELTKEEITELLHDRVAKWWVPDYVVFLDEIPKTSVGKLSKKELGAQSRTTGCRRSRPVLGGNFRSSSCSGRLSKTRCRFASLARSSSSPHPSFLEASRLRGGVES